MILEATERGQRLAILGRGGAGRGQGLGMGGPVAGSRGELSTATWRLRRVVADVLPKAVRRGCHGSYGGGGVGFHT